MLRPWKATIADISLQSQLFDFIRELLLQNHCSLVVGSGQLNFWQTSGQLNFWQLIFRQLIFFTTELFDIWTYVQLSRRSVVQKFSCLKISSPEVQLSRSSVVKRSVVQKFSCLKFRCLALINWKRAFSFVTYETYRLGCLIRILWISITDYIPILSFSC